MTIKARREDGAKEEEEKEGNHRRIEKRGCNVIPRDQKKFLLWRIYKIQKKNTQAAIIVASDLTSHLTDYR